MWSNRVFVTATGATQNAPSLAGELIPVSFDIEWALWDGHWIVEVRKVPDGYMGHPTRVEWSNRRILLCTENFEKTRHAGGIVSHEFGHSMGNTGVLNRGDEYRPTSPHHADKTSVINVGRELRTRHFRIMLEEMNRMIPDVRFSATLPR